MKAKHFLRLLLFAWANACHVEREMTHGSSAFKGNSCKKLLNNVDILRSQRNIGILKYVRVFDDFKMVVTSCFGNNLNSDYKICINAFRESYLLLGITVTPKVHAVFFHVAEFCEIKNMGLGYFSKQAIESVHYDFQNIWEQHKVAKNHPEYFKKFLRATCAYNSLHL